MLQISGSAEKMKIIFYLVDIIVTVYMCLVFLNPLWAFIAFMIMAVFGINWCVSNTKPQTIKT